MSALDLEFFRKRLAELHKAGAERADDPVFQANAKALGREMDQDRLAERRAVRPHLGIPVVFREVLDSPQETPALVKTREFLASEKLLLLLAGDVGRGKSVAASWAVEQATGRYVEAIDIVQASIYDADAWARFLSPRVLAIDELGMEPLDRGGWGESKFYDLINGRLQAKRRTILVTNLATGAFMARYSDDRLRDRLRAYGDFLVTKGTSMRERGRTPEPLPASAQLDRAP